MKIEKLIHTFFQLYKKNTDFEKKRLEEVEKFHAGMKDLLKLISTKEYQYLMDEYMAIEGDQKGLEINKYILFHKDGFEIMDVYIKQEKDLYHLENKSVFFLLNKGLNEEKIIYLVDKAFKKKYNQIIKKRRGFFR